MSDSLSGHYAPTSDEVAEYDSTVPDFDLLGSNSFAQDVFARTTNAGVMTIQVHNNRLHESTTVKLDEREAEQLYKQLRDHFGDNNNE